MAKKKKNPLTISQRRLSAEVRGIFEHAGFERLKSDLKEIEFKNIKSELDNVFLYDNIVIILEETAATNGIGDHLRKKVEFYRKIQESPSEFIDLMKTWYPDFSKYFEAKSYSSLEYKFRFLYCSIEKVDDARKKEYSDIIKVLDYRHVPYFLNIIKTVHKSGKYELFKFLGLMRGDIGDASKTGGAVLSYDGFILPEVPSGFDKDYFIVTFYIDPETLIPLSYVLRRDGAWNDTDALYQRLLIKSKIRKMRKYLKEDDRVYVNNIIVTLPSDTKLIDDSGDQITFEKINKVKAGRIKVTIPDEFNKIGIVDGQHRVFSYHEGNDEFEQIISQKRGKQNLLVTGVIFPKTLPEDKRLAFEGKLFLEINDKQSRVGSSLRQDIQAIIHPFEPVSIGKAVIGRLANDASSALEGKLEAHYFDKGKVKTSSIVSYGLKLVVNISSEPGKTTLFSVWKESGKEGLLNYAEDSSSEEQNKKLLQAYIDFCTTEINNIFIAYKKYLSPSQLFVLDKKVSRALSTTAINGVIHCLKEIIEKKGRVLTVDEYEKGFNKLKSIGFAQGKFTYKSSHWSALGSAIYQECFSEE